MGPEKGEGERRTTFFLVVFKREEKEREVFKKRTTRLKKKGGEEKRGEKSLVSCGEGRKKGNEFWDQGSKEEASIVPSDRGGRTLTSSKTRRKG